MKKYISAAVKDLSDIPPFELIQYAKNPLTSSRELQQINDYLESHPNLPSNVRYSLIWHMLAHPNVPQDILYRYAETSISGYWGAIAHNPNIPIDIAKRIASLGTLDVLEILASNPNIPVDLIKQFLESSNYDLNELAAANPSCPPELRKKFEEDNNVSSVYSIYLTAIDTGDALPYFLADVEACVRDTIRAAGYEYLGWDEDLGLTINYDRFTAYSSWVPDNDERNALADKIAENLEAAGHHVSEVEVDVDHYRN